MHQVDIVLSLIFLLGNNNNNNNNNNDDDDVRDSSALRFFIRVTQAAALWDLGL